MKFLTYLLITIMSFFNISYANSDSVDVLINVPIEENYTIYDATSVYNENKTKYDTTENIIKATKKDAIKNHNSLNVIDKISGSGKLSMSLDRNKTYLIYNEKVNPLLITGPVDLTSNNTSEFFIKEKEKVEDPTLRIKNYAINTSYYEVDFEYEVKINDKVENFSLKGDEEKEFILKHGDKYEIKQTKTPEGYTLKNITSPSGIINSDLDITVYNYYKPHGTFDISGKISAENISTKKKTKARDQEFLIELINEDREVVAITTNNKEGKFSFKDIEVDDEGEFNYKVRMVNEQVPGYTYDEKVFDVVVNTDDNLDGTLDVDVKADKIKFNTIRGTSNYKTFRLFNYGVKVNTFIKFEKDGEEFKSGMVINSNKNNPVIIEDNSLSLDNKEVISISRIPEGTTFEIVPEEKDGFKLSEESVLKGEVFKESALIENERTGLSRLDLSGSIAIKNADIKNYEFNFELINNGKVIETVKNKGNKIEFKPIDFDENDVGLHYYSIKQVYDKQANVEYDNNIYDIEVKVEDNGEEITVTPNIQSEEILFENTNTEGLMEEKIDSKKEVIFDNPTEEVSNVSNYLLLAKKYWWVILIVILILFFILR